LDFVVSVSISVLDKFANASVTELHASTLQAILVGLADAVKSIDWWTVTWVRHWAVTKNKTVATVGPVFALIEV